MDRNIVHSNSCAVMGDRHLWVSIRTLLIFKRLGLISRASITYFGRSNVFYCYKALCEGILKQKQAAKPV